MNRSTTGKNPLISDWSREVVCLPQWEKYPKPIRENPLTDVNLAIVCRTILAASSIIPARAAKELLEVVPSLYLSFFSKVYFCFFFLKKVGNVLSVFIQKVQWIEWKRDWEKTLINTAWPLTSQTRAYQQDLETTPETTLTSLRKKNPYRHWMVPKWSEMCLSACLANEPSEIGKNRWLTLNSP